LRFENKWVFQDLEYVLRTIAKAFHQRWVPPPRPAWRQGTPPVQEGICWILKNQPSMSQSHSHPHNHPPQAPTRITNHNHQPESPMMLLP
jgi:hypothetical protein